jgi:hypothetical protein
MIKHPVLLMCIILFVACSHQKSQPVTKRIVAKESKNRHPILPNKKRYANPLLNQYAEFIKSLNITDAETSSQAARQYSILFKGEDENTCDSAFLIFNRYYEKLNSNLDDLHHKRTGMTDSLLIGNIKPDRLPATVANYLSKLKRNGFEIITEEGDTYVGQERDFIAKWFYDYVSPVMKEYLLQLNKENKQVYIEDNSILISATDLVDRTIWWEQFIKNNPGFISIDEATVNKNSYLQLLLEGTENSYVVNVDNNKLSDYFKNAYNYINDKYPSSDAAKLVAPYYALLKEGKKLKADSLMNVYRKQGVTG